jgi:hypothetical protein
MPDKEDRKSLEAELQEQGLSPKAAEVIAMLASAVETNQTAILNLGEKIEKYHAEEHAELAAVKRQLGARRKR